MNNRNGLGAASALRLARLGVLGLTLAPGFAEQPATQDAEQRPQNDPHAQHRMPQEKSGAPPHDHSQMGGHQGMPGMDHTKRMNDAGAYLMNMASGTSMNSESWPMPMLMPRLGSWNLMLMGQGFLVDTQQSGPRGYDKLYAPNWFMGSAERSLGRGSVMFQTMLSLDPATVTDRRYPLLFQTGETAFGKPLVDAQHPHDLFMGIGVHYAHPLGEATMLQLYYAPVGDPALGPVAFPHRASASEMPQAPLGHHWQDSTHIAANVVTLVLKHKWLRLEGSGFYGTEPNENRWNFDWGPMNSYSGRISIFPARNWMAQFSAGKLIAPEQHAKGDVVRTTASLHYTRPLNDRNAWSTSIIWGRNHKQVGEHGALTSRNLNSYLIETLYPVSRKNFLTGRVEAVDKDELFADNHELEHQLERTAGSTFRVGAFTAGFTRDIGSLKNVHAGVGANVTTYAVASALKPFYGDHPWGINFFLRLRLGPAE